MSLLFHRDDNSLVWKLNRVYNYFYKWSLFCSLDLKLCLVFDDLRKYDSEGKEEENATLTIYKKLNGTPSTWSGIACGHVALAPAVVEEDPLVVHFQSAPREVGVTVRGARTVNNIKA